MLLFEPCFCKFSSHLLLNLFCFYYCCVVFFAPNSMHELKTMHVAKQKKKQHRNTRINNSKSSSNSRSRYTEPHKPMRETLTENTPSHTLRQTQHDWLLLMLSNTDSAVILFARRLLLFYCQRWIDSLSLSLSRWEFFFVRFSRFVCMWLHPTTSIRTACTCNVTATCDRPTELSFALTALRLIVDGCLRFCAHTILYSGSCALFT